MKFLKLSSKRAKDIGDLYLKRRFPGMMMRKVIQTIGGLNCHAKEMVVVQRYTVWVCWKATTQSELQDALMMVDRFQIRIMQ